MRLKRIEPLTTTLPPLAARLWLRFFSAVLLGYAVFGKAFAYLGVPPVFIGEVTIVVGLICGVRLWMLRTLKESILAGPLLLFGIWGAVRTAPYLSEYGVDALRDGAAWGYSILAFMLFLLSYRYPWTIVEGKRFYLHAAQVCLGAFPVITILLRFVQIAPPYLPWADVPILHMKANDMLVHVSAASVFFFTQRIETRFPWRVLTAVNLVMLSVVTRGGMLAAVAAFLTLFLVNPRRARMASLAVVLALLLTVTALMDVRVDIGAGRELSVRQLVANLSSVVSDSDEAVLAGSKEWRLDWWRTIIQYAFWGDYRWSGRGYGINLADADGFQVTSDRSLRSPHNGHLTFLARSGIPGLFLWLAVVIGWIVVMLRQMRRARLAGHDRVASLTVFMLCYLVAMTTSLTFDVSIEGPMLAFWYWTIYGLGMGLCAAYKHAPGHLEAMFAAAPDASR